MPTCCTTRRAFGAITAEQALTQGAPDVTPTQRAAMIAWMNASQLLNTSGVPAYVPGSADCSAAGGSGQSGNVKLAQMAGGLALQGINVAAAVSSGVAAAIGVALGPLTLGISTLIGLFPLLFGHHAQAVKKEQSVLCSAVPAANNYLQIIDQAVTSGAATVDTANAALDSLVSQFFSAVSSIYKKCNAACVMTEGLKAIVLMKKSQYQDMQAAANAAAAAVAAGSAQVVNSSRPNTTSNSSVVPSSAYSSFYTPGNPAPTVAAPSTSSDWLPIAAAVGAGFLLMRLL